MLWPAAVALGVAAEWAAYDWGAIRFWLPDLVVGWTFLGCGLVAWSRRRESRTGLLLAATGLAWFAGNFAGSLIYLHRGPLVHCVLAYPSGRLRSRVERATVSAGYLAALAPPVGRNETATIALAVLIVAVAARGYLPAVGRERRARVHAVQAASALGIVLAGVAAGRLALPDGEANEAVLRAYEVTLVALAMALLIGLLRAPWKRAAVTDLVVELGDVSSGTLRDALARALGDPTLEVGYWLAAGGLPVEAVQVIDTTDRAAVGALVRQVGLVDVIIPRGGRGLIERIASETRIPVIKHLDGICHVYIDASAETRMAVDIAVNSKTEKYAVCNAIETLLVHQDRADELLPLLEQRFIAAGVELRGCAATLARLPSARAATEEDWYAEYLGPILAVRVVASLDEAIEHINCYGSQHTDAIVTADLVASRRFVTEVDSASVMVNTSTQFADGFEFGLGAEIGISTDKLHARGPVGLEGLTTQKYVVYGQGEVRKR